MRTRLFIIIIVTLLGASACGSAAATSHGPVPASTSTPAVAGPANPVTMVRRAGATPDPGEVYGTTTVQGWLGANGTFPRGERITVYTLPPGTMGLQAVAQIGAASSDSQVMIVGSNFYAYAYPAQNQDTLVYSWPGPSAAAVAARLHGTVMAPS